MILDFNALSPNRIYHTMIQTLIPRPVAWVLSDNGISSNSHCTPEQKLDDPNRWNLAPFSYFNALSNNPPLLMMSIGKKPPSTHNTSDHPPQLVDKDTRQNIVEREYFTVHIAHREQAEQVTLTSTGLAHGQSELALADLAITDFDGFATPRLSDCRIAYGCQRYRIENLTDTQGLLIAEIKKMYICDSILTPLADGKFTVDALKLDPIARLGGDDYGFISEVQTIKRPK